MGSTEYPLCWIEAHAGNPDNPGAKWKVLARHKWVSGATITESELIEDDPISAGTFYRRFTATVRGWRGFRIFEGRLYPDVIKDVKAKVIEIRDRIDAGDESVFLESPQIQGHNAPGGDQMPPNLGGECTSVREILEVECAKAKPIIDEKLGNKWPFCEILNEYFKKCSSGDSPGNPLKPIKFKKDVKTSKRVEPFRTPEGKHFREELSKLDPWIYHKRITEYFEKDEDEPSNPGNPGKPPRLYNDAELYWLEPTKLFGKPAYNVRRWLRAKPVAQFFDKEKAENRINTENAYIYLQSRIKDRRFLIGIAEKVGLKEDELEGFSNASILGEITGSDDYAGIVKELAEKIPSTNPGNPCNPGPTRYVRRGQTLPGRQMWLLEEMCLRAGIDTMMIDPTLTYWENKAEIEREEHEQLHLTEGGRRSKEVREMAALLSAERMEEAEAWASYRRAMGKNH